MSEITPVTPVTLVDEKTPAAQLTLAVQNSGLELESAQGVLNTFSPLLEQAEKWRKQVELIHVTDVSQKAEMKLANAARMGLRGIRLNAEKARKRLKEESLRRGKAIDGAYNIIEFIIAPLEKNLLEQEQFAERKEAERKATLKVVRTEALAPFIDVSAPPAGYVLEEMTDETFAGLLLYTKTTFEAKQTAVREAEASRIAKEQAEAAEKERLRQENARLQAEREAIEAKARAERDAAEKALRAELNQKLAQQKAESDETARKEKLRLQALAEIARIAKENERKAAEANAAALRALEDSKSDKTKIAAFAEQVRHLAIPPIKQISTVPLSISAALQEVAGYIDSLAETL